MGTLLTNGSTLIDMGVSLISSVGFPIVAYFMMVKSNQQMQENHRDEVKNLNDSYALRNKEMTEALDRNTKVLDRNNEIMDKLIDKLS